jgi:hypothetical protein
MPRKLVVDPSLRAFAQYMSPGLHNTCLFSEQAVLRKIGFWDCTGTPGVTPPLPLLQDQRVDSSSIMLFCVMWTDISARIPTTMIICFTIIRGTGSRQTYTVQCTLHIACIHTTSSSLKVVEMHTWSSDWKRVIINIVIVIRQLLRSQLLLASWHLVVSGPAD